MQTKSSNYSLGGLLVLACLVASGCQVAQMKVDPALTDVAALPVKGNSGRMWDRRIQFGEWQTTSVNEGWLSDRRTEVGSADGTSATAFDRLRKRYRFGMATNSGSIEARCSQLGQVASHTESSGRWEDRTEVDVAMLRGTPPLQCTYDGAGGGSLKLTKQMTVAATQAGEIEFAGQPWTVSEVTRIEGGRPSSLAPMSGYEIRRGARVIAAVEVINQGRVWISPELSPLDRDRAAAIVTTLLLYRPVEPV